MKRIIIFIFFILEFPYFLQEVLSEGENPITLNIQNLNLLIWDNNSIIYNPSGTAIYNNIFNPTNISFFENYNNKNISKLNDTSFIVTGISNNNLYFQIFNISNNQTSNITTIKNLHISSSNYNLGLLSNSQFIISYFNNQNYYSLIISLSGTINNNISIGSYQNAPFGKIKCLGYSSSEIICLYLHNSNSILKLISIDNSNSNITYNISNTLLPNFNVNRNNKKIYVCYHEGINLYCDILFANNSRFNFIKKKLFINLVYKVSSGTANNEVSAFPEILFFNNIVFIIYEEKSDNRYNFVVNFYFEDLDYLLNQILITFTSLISDYSFIITNQYIILEYENSNSINYQTTKIIECNNKNIKLSSNNPSQTFNLYNNNNCTIYNTNSNFTISIENEGDIYPKNNFFCNKNIIISYQNISDSFDYYFSISNSTRGNNFSLICNISVFSCYKSCGDCYTNSTGNNNIHNCRSCATNFYPYCNNSLNCYDNTNFPFGYYLNSTNQCFDKCDLSCKNCTNSTSCDQCNDNYFKKTNETNGLCYKNPLSNYYLTEESTFSPCNNKCNKCFGNEIYECTNCITNYTIYNYFSNRCVYNVDNCSKWYLNLTELVCVNSCSDIYEYTVENSNQCVSKREEIFNINATVQDESQNTLYYKFEMDKKFYLECPNGTNRSNTECIIMNNTNYGNKDMIIFNVLNNDEYFVNYTININQIQKYIEHRQNYSNNYNTSVDLVELFKCKDFQFAIFRYTNEGNSNITDFFRIHNLIIVNYTNIFIDKRNLDSGSEIIIVQSDALRINDYTNQTEYLVYLVNEGINSINNIDISSDKNVNIYYPLRNINENISNIINISKKGIDISDINSPFYNDICYNFTNEDKKDVTIEDRRKYYFLNINFCENNCKLISVDFMKFESNCDCKVKEKYSKIIISTIQNNNTELKKVNNINSLKCIKQLITRKNLPSNYAFWFCIILLIMLITNILWSAKVGIKKFKKYYIKIIEIKENIQIQKQNNNNIKNESINIYQHPNPPKKKVNIDISNTTIEQEDKVSEIKYDNFMLKEDVEPIYNNYMAKKEDILLNFNTDNNNNENKKTENEDENKNKKNVLSESSKDDNIYNKKQLFLKNSISNKRNISEEKQSNSEREKIINSFEKSIKDEAIDDRINLKKSNNLLNDDLNYKNLIKDEDDIFNKNKNMSFISILCRYFRKKEILLFPLTNAKKYIPFYISFSIFLLSINYIFLIYCFFFTTKNVHERFLNKGNLGIIYVLKKEIFNCILTGFISLIIKNLFNKFLIFLFFRINKKKVSKEKLKSFINYTKLKVFLFYFIVIILFIFSSYINICYGGVFKNSIKGLLFGSLFSYIISFILCFLLCLLFVIFRKIGCKFIWKICRLLY